LAAIFGGNAFWNDLAMNANTVKMLSASKRSKQAQIRQRLERAAMEAGVVPRAIQA
jgi:hypothetical protein